MSQYPIADLLRACAERIEAGEPWRDAMGDYGLLLLPSDRGRDALAEQARVE